MAFGHAQQDHGGAEVDERGGGADAQPEKRRLERLGPQKARDGGCQNARRSEDDQRAFDTRGEILRFGKPVRMLVARRGRGEAQHGKREKRGCKVDDGLERIRQQANRAGQPPGEGLERDGGERSRDRQPGEALEVHAGRMMPVSSTQVRSATRAVNCWLCSASSTATPARFSSTMARATCSTTTGARPSEGSSS